MRFWAALAFGRVLQKRAVFGAWRGVARDVCFYFDAGKFRFRRTRLRRLRRHLYRLVATLAAFCRKASLYQMGLNRRRDLPTGRLRGALRRQRVKFELNLRFFGRRFWVKFDSPLDLPNLNLKFKSKFCARFSKLKRLNLSRDICVYNYNI